MSLILGFNLIRVIGFFFLSKLDEWVLIDFHILIVHAKNKKSPQLKLTMSSIR
jgi:hypothetical protein